MAILRVRRVRSEDERNTANADFISLSEAGEKFLGVALFQGDPTEDELGYYEYFEHWSNAFKSVPCAGDDCPLCKEGDRPKTRAKTMWMVDDEVKVFTMNSLLISQFTDLRGEDEKILGRVFRVTRLDDRGNYSLFPKDVELKPADVKKTVKEADIDLEEMVLTQLKRKYEQMNIVRALDDDGDGPSANGDEPVKARAGTAKKKTKAAPEPEPDNDDPDELEDETVTITKIVKGNNTATVEWNDGTLILFGTEDIDVADFSKGDEVVVSAEKDADDDLVLSSMEAAPTDDTGADGEDGEVELPDEIDGETFVVVSVDAQSETIDVENDESGLKFTLYFLGDKNYDGDLDFDDFTEGQKITVSAKKDDVGDLVATEIPTPAKAKRGRPKKSA